jgi:hypothetical protein
MSMGKPPQPGQLSGLDPAEAARRLAAHGPNLLPGNAPMTWWAKVAGVVLEPEEIPQVLTVFLALGAWLISNHGRQVDLSPVKFTAEGGAAACVFRRD